MPLLALGGGAYAPLFMQGGPPEPAADRWEATAGWLAGCADASRAPGMWEAAMESGVNSACFAYPDDQYLWGFYGAPGYRSVLRAALIAEWEGGGEGRARMQSAEQGGRGAMLAYAEAFMAAGIDRGLVCPVPERRPRLSPPPGYTKTLASGSGNNCFLSSVEQLFMERRPGSANALTEADVRNAGSAHNVRCRFLRQWGAARGLWPGGAHFISSTVHSFRGALQAIAALTGLPAPQASCTVCAGFDGSLQQVLVADRAGFARWRMYNPVGVHYEPLWPTEVAELPAAPPVVGDVARPPVVGVDPPVADVDLDLQAAIEADLATPRVTPAAPVLGGVQPAAPVPDGTADLWATMVAAEQRAASATPATPAQPGRVPGLSQMSGSPVALCAACKQVAAEPGSDPARCVQCAAAAAQPAEGGNCKGCVLGALGQARAIPGTLFCARCTAVRAAPAVRGRRVRASMEGS